MRTLLVLLAGLALVAPGRPLAAQPGAPLSISAQGASAGWQSVVRLHGLLDDAALRGALHSGLPLRVHLRVELWRDAFVDQLADARDTYFALSYDPLDRSYLFEDGRGAQRVATLNEAEAVIGTALVVPIRPGGRGRYYYLASLEIETLSLSDLDELRRWLRGDAREALQGRGSVGRAVETGLRRAFVRAVGLSARRYQARTPTFSVG